MTDETNNQRNATTGIDDFEAAWRAALQQMGPTLDLMEALIGLTRLGEHRVESQRLAKVLGLSVSEAEELALQHGWPGVQVQNGLISLNPERAQVATRRQLRVGGRRFGFSGCAPDLLIYAAVLGPSLQVDDTCPATGKAIHVDFTPRGVERVDPVETVVALLNPQWLDLSVFQEDRGIDKIDADFCVQQPFFASYDAARGWLADHPGGRVFPVREAWDLSFFNERRDALRSLLSIER